MALALQRGGALRCTAFATPFDELRVKSHSIRSFDSLKAFRGLPRVSDERSAERIEWWSKLYDVQTEASNTYDALQGAFSLVREAVYA
jgi:hypothetical protein